ncbi:unnamed protein product [Somion occarium]|uniref:Origin recognition complex subunit 4 n=1 Tax=Somion occarium TaxID=3059160 RepID=A0ABP1D0R9_9APHY
MPPKRKASTAGNQDGTLPLKRRLRTTNGPLLDTQPAVTPSTGRVRSRIVKKSPENLETEEDSTPAGESSAQPLRRGRPSKASALKSKALPKALVDDTPPKPSTSKETLDDADYATEDAEAELPDDELLLSPRKRKPATRPVTPPRSATHGQMNGSPRYLLHSVEVPTPSWVNKPNLSRHHDATSPIPPHRNARKTTRSTTPEASNRISQTVLSSLPSTPSRSLVRSPIPSPRRSPRKAVVQTLQSDTDDVPWTTASPPLSPSKESLHTCLDAQKAAILKALYKSPPPSNPDEDEDDVAANVLSEEQLTELLKGTVLRGEGNSCILTGPPGSGKTQMVERVMASLPETPIIVRLSGHAQTDDRLAMREIAWQLAQQTGTSLMPHEENNDVVSQDEENPFIETTSQTVVSLPPPAHLLALISVIPTLSRPTIIVLDAFDLFALHARQSLLYCLFDTAQHSRVGINGKGMAVVGVTTRIDTINLLEKRVKSRFSGRILRTAGPTKLKDWLGVARSVLCLPIESEHAEEWTTLWQSSVDEFLADDAVKDALTEIFALTRDFRMLCRILTPPILELNPSAPFLSSSQLIQAIRSQRCPDLSFLPSLPYPAICLLIAAAHTRISGHDTFTFEMLHEAFRDQVRTSLSAPVQVRGGGIGMVRCSREVLIGAFERLIALRIFVAAAIPSAGISREFVRYRSTLDHADVKLTVERTGQLNLKKWLSKGKSN